MTTPDAPPALPAPPRPSDVVTWAAADGTPDPGVDQALLPAVRPSYLPAVLDVPYYDTPGGRQEMRRWGLLFVVLGGLLVIVGVLLLAGVTL